MDWQAFAIAIATSSALSTLISQIFTAREKSKEKETGEQQALRLILKDRLRFLCMEYIKQGWIYDDELEDLTAMYDSYHNGLSGNGYLDNLMDRVKHLDIKGIGIN